MEGLALNPLPLTGTQYKTAGPVPATTEITDQPADKKTVLYWVVIFGALLLLKYTSNRSEDMTPSIMGIGVYNFIAVTLMAIFGIVGMKVIFNKYKVPGMTELVNAV